MPSKPKNTNALSVEKKDGISFVVQGSIPLVVNEGTDAGPHVAAVLQKLVVAPMAEGEGLTLPPGTYRLQLLITVS